MMNGTSYASYAYALAITCYVGNCYSKVSSLNNCFGSVSTLAVGDVYQLLPVTQNTS